ncbi:MAG: YhdP family phospholipid transporter, partial [Gammaproteobacteria bacterium]
ITVKTPQQGNRTTSVRYGDRFNAAFVDGEPGADNNRAFLGGEVVFDDSRNELQPRENKISLHGRIAELKPDSWRRIIKSVATRANSSESKMPIEVDVAIGKLEILGNIFSNTRISGNGSRDGWLVKLNAEGLTGEVTAPTNTELPIKLRFSQLHFVTPNKSDRANSINPRDVRPFDLESLATSYGDVELGKVSMTIQRSQNGLRIVEAFSEQGDVEVRGSGDWTFDDNLHESRINVSVRGNSLAGLLGGFGYDIANIEGGATSLELDSRWYGTPFEFSLDKLSGHLSLSVESGRFLDIEPGGGRLFGLLSLQTLPRRLSLDFNDLFSKGFTFDTIAGTFSIDHGNAYTNSLMMDGPSARIQISGRTGLKEQDYDQRVTVTPALSNSIPVASALFGPAGIGVGAVIYLGQKMFKSIPEKMDKFLSREYSITGAWSSPVIEKI